VLVGRLA